MLEVQGHHQLHNKFKASLHYMRLYLLEKTAFDLHRVSQKYVFVCLSIHAHVLQRTVGGLRKSSKVFAAGSVDQQKAMR